MTLATAHKHITRRGIGYRGSNHFRGSERKTATRQMRDRVERIMKEGLGCDCCSAEIKALFTEWIECYGCEHRLNQSNEMSNRECTLKTKEIADKLIPLMEKCGCDICKRLLGSAGAAVAVIIPTL